MSERGFNSRRVHYRNEAFYLDTLRGGYQYEILANQLKSSAQLIEWIHHLCAKTWCDRELISGLIEGVYWFKEWQLNDVHVPEDD